MEGFIGFIVGLVIIVIVYFIANFIANLDFPEAVGPANSITFFSCFIYLKLKRKFYSIFIVI